VVGEEREAKKVKITTKENRGTCAVLIIDVWRGVFKKVEDGRRPPTMQAGYP